MLILIFVEVFSKRKSSISSFSEGMITMKVIFQFAVVTTTEPTTSETTTETTTATTTETTTEPTTVVTTTEPTTSETTVQTTGIGLISAHSDKY